MTYPAVLPFILGLICGAVATAIALVALMAEAKRRQREER